MKTRDYRMEVPLLSGESCILTSINLHQIYNKKTKQIDYELLKDIVKTNKRFLDDVTEISIAPVDKINEMTKGLRRISLGVLGFADLLVELDIPYDSPKAIELSNYLSWFISFHSWETSYELAKERGSFPLYEKDKCNFHVIEKTLYQSPYGISEISFEDLKNVGVRNVATTGLPPTGSIAIIGGVNSSLEPFYALAYRRNITEGIGNIAKDSIFEINPALENKLKESGYSKDEIECIVAYASEVGSLAGCELITKDLQDLFKTANEIDWHTHVDIQAAWQEYVSNAISKCVAKGTLIQTNKGIFPIEKLGYANGNDVFDKPLDGLMVLDEYGNWKKVLNHYSGGNKPTISIRTDNGFCIEASENHKIMTNRGWKKFSELSIGDWILNRSPEKNNNFQLLGELPIEKESLYHNGNGVNPINLPEKMSVNFAKFLGMLCADGSTIVSRGCTCLTTADNDVEKTFTDLCIEIFGIMPRFTKDIRTKNTRSLSITSRPLVRMIQKLIGKGCINKKIPDQILQGSYEEKKAFIEGVTLDGYIKSTGNNKTIPQKKSLCIYEGYSEILAKQLYMCLIELGTIPRINFKKVRSFGIETGPDTMLNWYR